MSPAAPDTLPPTAPTLQWPPPGLESVYGRIDDVVRPMRWANLLLAGVFVLFARFSDSISGSTVAILGGVLLADFVLLLVALRTLIATVDEATRAIRRGYTWLTFAEVLADRRRDGGAVIAGLDEYERTTPGTRTLFRWMRITSAALQFAGAIAPPLSMFMSLWLGLNSSLLTIALFAFGPVALIWFARQLIEQAELIAIGAARRSRDGRLDGRESRANIIEPWYATFDAAREGQALGRGRAGGKMYGWVGAGITALALLFAGAVLIPICFAPMAYRASMQPRLMSGVITARTPQIRVARRYRSLVDASITPAQAATALHRAMSIGRMPGATRGDLSLYRPPAQPLRPLPRTPDSSFQALDERGRRRPTHEVMIERAKAGASLRERAYFEEISTHPAWPDVERAASASRAEYDAVRLVSPLPRDLSALTIPGNPGLSSYDLAIANTARAAWHLTHGRGADAERVLRQTISVGLLLIDASTSGTDAANGYQVVSVGQAALQRFYALTNPGAAAEMEARLDSVRREGVRGVSAGRTLYAAAVIRDTLMPRGMRHSAILAAEMEACMTVRGVLFGPDWRTQALIDDARKQIVQSKTDEDIFNAYEFAMERPIIREGSRNNGYRPPHQLLTAAAAKLSAAVLRRPRIKNCAGGPMPEVVW